EPRSLRAARSPEGSSSTSDLSAGAPAPSAEPEVADRVAAEEAPDRLRGHAVPAEHRARLLHGARVVVRVARSPRGDALEHVGHASDRVLPRVEGDERRACEEDALGLEADVADAGEEPQVGLRLLERERDPGGTRVDERQLERRV